MTARPYKTNPTQWINIRVPASLMPRIDAWAERALTHGQAFRSRSAAIIALLTGALAEDERETPT